MVYFRTSNEINHAFQPLVGRYNLSTVAHTPNSSLAL